jgi:hypothetical protein
MAEDQLPRLSELKTPAIDALVALRPKAAAHIYAGRWGDLIEGWAAQAALCRNRTAKEILSARLRLASKDSIEALIELAAEFSALIDPAPQKAVGEIFLQRTTSNTNPGTTGNFGNFGFIKAGHRFRRPADPDAWPPRDDATYGCAEPTLVADEDTQAPVPNGPSYTHTQTVQVPIEAERAGPHANTIVRFGLLTSQALPGQIVDTLFDTRFTVLRLLAAGGTNGPTPDQLIQYAQAAYTGQHGPNQQAIVAGAFSYPGVKHVGLVLNGATAVDKLWIGDESWGGSQRFGKVVSQRIRDSWLAFGGRFDVDYIPNALIAVKATVMLSSPQYADDVSEISDRIRTKVQAYFDNRPDWWTWKELTLQGVIARADRRSLTCTTAIVTDAAGTSLSEPSGALSPTTAQHYMLAGNPLKLTFVLPS